MRTSNCQPGGGESPGAGLRLLILNAQREPFLRITLPEMLSASLITPAGAEDLRESLQVRKFYPLQLDGLRLYVTLDVQIPDDVVELLRELRRVKVAGAAAPAEIARIDRYIQQVPA